MDTAMQPLVSVVIPAWNMANLLGDTLRSVLDSTYSHLEVIVVNDGSTDDTAAVAHRFAEDDARVCVITQPNGGVCKARNAGIRRARGEYILPVDADNLISPTLIADAVCAIHGHAEVKAVQPRADFFGARSGEWMLPPFSLHRIARKNIMDTCALYRRADWERVGGYCEEIIAREDWDFWISVMKDGGEVVRLPEIGLHYRMREGSKRVTDRKLKRHVIDVLNRRHPEFFERELGGPLRYHRTWSRAANRLLRFFCPRRIVTHPDFADMQHFAAALPQLFRANAGRVIHAGRNELREMDYRGRCFVIKSYKVPNIINRIAYGLLRASKAQRSYEYALRLRELGIGSPVPAAWVTLRRGLLFTHSYYVSLRSECPHTYAALIGGAYPDTDRILCAIARTTAQLHEAGIIHRDYSRGNILFNAKKDGVDIELIDLNRLRFPGKVSLREGCRNFAERLPATDAMRRTMAKAYAEARGFSAEECYEVMAHGGENEAS